MLKDFKLKLSSEVLQSRAKLQEVLQLKRIHHTIEIAGVTGCHDALLRVIRRFAFTLRSLTISNSRIDDFILREVLKSAESLDSLCLSEVVILKKLPAINPVNMLSLKSLKIRHCDWAIFKFMNAQITSLELKSYLDEGSRSNLISFLTRQCKLKELMLKGTSARTIFQQDEVVANCNFCLDKFSLEQDFGKNSDNVNWHCTAFLSLHCETLENVEISGPHCGHISGFAISNLDNLFSLVLDVRGLPKDEDFYDAMEQNPNYKLKDLSLRGFFVQPEAIKKIVLKYPSIVKLELNDWGQLLNAADMLGFVSRNFPKLQKLSITEITNNVKFEALKNLRVQYIRNTGKLAQFVLENPSVETLKVALVYIGQITSKFIEELEHVKYLSFGGNEKALSSILELIKKKTPEGLQTLELLSLKNEDKSAFPSGRALKFHVPIEITSKFDLL